MIPTNKIIYSICLLFCLASCSEYLDKAPDENLSLDDVFANRNYAEGWLAGAYGLLPWEGYDNLHGNFPYRSSPFSTGSDEVESSLNTAFGTNINRGDWNPLNINSLSIWTNSYLGIRRVNTIIENADKIPTTDKERTNWLGEAYFLRALFYFNLVRCWGAVPIVDRTLTSDDDMLAFTRAPIDRCIQFIASDCDEAYARLDKQLPPSQYGRANAIAALGLKARALLYMASPLFNGGTAGKPGVPDLTTLTNTDGTRLFPDHDAARWQQAADAAKRCIDEALANGYGLYLADNGDPVQSYRDLFARPYNKEVLFARNNGADIFLTFSGYPRSQSGWGTLAVLQDLVDEYQMADGSTPITGYQPNGTPIINPASGYSEADVFVDQPGRYHPSGVHIMYANREPRFYADVNFTGQIGFDGNPLNFYAGEKDGYVPTSGENFTKTGYLQKRYVLDGANPQTGSVPAHTWKYLRLGEVYLNYAEALNEALAAPDENVYRYVNMIRDRAGLPNLPGGLNKEEMRARIWHERRIELAFENHRFFDVRRWLVASESQGAPVHGMNINATVQTPFGFFRRTEVERRVFQDRHYLFPIPQDDINKNRGIVQNPGWE